ncbi:MAG: flagellar basal body-associated FliL family protein [Chloroflexi bacterium]|nr:flagellar basal body-associated FliL family protein [Chloroflexota bacterium]
MGKFKLVIIAVGLLVAMGAGYFFAAPIVLGKSSGLPLITAAAKGAAQDTPTPEAVAGITYSSQERVFNLADQDSFRYLKAQIVIEFELPGVNPDSLVGEAYTQKQAEFQSEHVAELPRIEDAITSVLTSKTSQELITSDGKEKLKTELKSVIGGIIKENKVRDIYFTQFIIQ